MGNCCSDASWQSSVPAPATMASLVKANKRIDRLQDLAERKLRQTLEIDKFVCPADNQYDELGTWDITPPSTPEKENTYEKRLLHLTKLAFNMQDSKAGKPEDYTRTVESDSHVDFTTYLERDNCIKFAVYLKRWTFRYIDLLALQVEVCAAHLTDQVELIIDACKRLGAPADPQAVFLKSVIMADKSPMQDCANKEKWKKDRLKIAGYFLDIGDYHRKFNNMLVDAIEKYQDIDLARLLLRHKAAGKFDAMTSTMWYGLRDPKSPPLTPTDGMPTKMHRRLKFHSRSADKSANTASSNDINLVAIVAGDGSTIHVNNGNITNVNNYNGGSGKSDLDEQAWQARSRSIQRLMTMLIHNSNFHPNTKLWETEPYSEWAAYLSHWLMLRMKPANGLANFNSLVSSPCRGCQDSSSDYLQHLACDPLLLMPDFEDEDLPTAKKFIALLESDLTRKYNPQSPNYPLYAAWLARKQTASTASAASIASAAPTLPTAQVSSTTLVQLGIV